MTFGGALELMLRRNGYSLLSEFVTPDRRMAVRLRELASSSVLVMYHSDAIELVRGGATVDAISWRNRAVFAAPTAAGAHETTNPERTIPTNHLSEASISSVVSGNRHK
jgi:hypothetical protein